MSLRHSISLGRKDRQTLLLPPVASYLSLNRGTNFTLDVSTDPEFLRDQRVTIASDSPEWCDITTLMSTHSYIKGTTLLIKIQMPILEASRIIGRWHCVFLSASYRPMRRE